MNLLKLSALFILIFATSSFAQSAARSSENTADMPVVGLQLEASNINQLLAKIAYKYNVPMSLEIATNEDLLNGKSLMVQLKKGTLADVLDDIVRQKASYTWEASESLIRIFPKDEFRDPLLQTVLETRISHFVLLKSTARLNFREKLTLRPELKNLLASYGVRPSNEAFSRSDTESFGGDFSMHGQNVSVRSILDDVITKSKTKYWFINRNGDSREYLLINF